VWMHDCVEDAWVCGAGGRVGALCLCEWRCEGGVLEVQAAVEGGPVDPEEDGADEREEVRCHRGL
jgi:hypothetical protein